jgi:hypothetical protein
MGIVVNRLQWLSCSLVRPVFSEPKSSATRLSSLTASEASMDSADCRSGSTVWRISRLPMAVVPTTRVQSAMASARALKRRALRITLSAATADFISAERSCSASI